LVLLVHGPLEDTSIWKKWEEMKVDFAFCKGLKFLEYSKQQHHQQGHDIDSNASTSLTELTSPPGSSTTIIVCDDEEDILTVLCRALKTKFNVITASSGRECIEKYNEIRTLQNGNSKMFLLLDYRLGDMLGDQVACKIKEINHIKIFLMSAYEFDTTVIDNMKKNDYIAGFLRKPFKIMDIVRLLEQELTL
jgi:CheY-like chemotaxis protein